MLSGVVIVTCVRNNDYSNHPAYEKAENGSLLQEMSKEFLTAKSIFGRNFFKRSSLLPHTTSVGESQQGNLVLNAQNAAERLDINLNEKDSVYIYSVLSATFVLWEKSREDQMRPLL